MIQAFTFSEIKLNDMFYWSGLYFIKINEEFAEYGTNKKFFFHLNELVQVDEHCKEYNENEAGK